MDRDHLTSAVKQFLYYKMLGDKAFDQVPDEALFLSQDAANNSMAMIVQHLHGNMMSRWTDLLNSDGEKEWRNRDMEFEPVIRTREEMIRKWEEGWNCLFSALKDLKEEDMNKIIYIRNQGHTVAEAINRQLAHYPYHVGQIVLLAKLYCGKEWNSLSIPKNASSEYNREKFAAEKKRGHFTDEYLKQKKSK